jgi:type IV secretory pathway VirJ component
LYRAGLLAAAVVGAVAALLLLKPAPAASVGLEERMPLTTSPASGAGDTLVILYSGDGGWAPIDEGLSSGFVRAGLPVVGVDATRYFWTRRTPRGAAADLEAVMRRYMATWGKARVVLAGYSFGADALPAIVPQLPDDLRGRLRSVVLIGVAAEGRLIFQPRDWLGNSRPPSGEVAYPVSLGLARMHDVPVLCVYGDREADPICPALSSSTVKAIRLPGGHHYDGDYALLSRTIMRALPK